MCLSRFWRTELEEDVGVTPEVSSEVASGVSQSSVPPVAIIWSADPTPQVVTTPTPPRPLDQIHQELLAAKAAHQAAVAAVQSSQDALTTLVAEYHSALTWFAEEEKNILADLDDFKDSVGNWVLNQIKKI